MLIRSFSSRFLEWFGPAVIACLGGLAVLVAIDPAGDYPNAPQGPGITIDESFNVQQGVLFVGAIRNWGVGLLHPDSIREVFGSESFLPDHPPLGRLWIGVAHAVTLWLFPPENPPPHFVIACARTAPASAFALLIFLIGYVAAKWYGPGAGSMSALALVLIPRLFGHAHLASLETFIGLTYAAAALSVAHFWTRRRTPTRRTACLTGVLFGLALLTKIQAVLLIVPIVIWALAGWKKQAILPVMLWGSVGLLVFFLGWPWLWLDPIQHMTDYFSRATARTSLSVWYFGQKFADQDVPWHYPWILFLTTVPVGLHAFGVTGLAFRRTSSIRSACETTEFLGKPSRGSGETTDSGSGRNNVREESRERLLMGCIAFPLILFSLPGIRVYDGARLFLVVYPLWAVFIGRGGLWVWHWLRTRFASWSATAILGVTLVAQSYGLFAFHPCYLSHYNLLVGGLRGAARLGFEPTYWGDSITRSFLRSVVECVPQGATIAVFPALHPFQWETVCDQSPLLHQHNISLQIYSTPGAEHARFLMIFRRNADLPPKLRGPVSDARLLAEVRRDGVQLSALYQLAESGHLWTRHDNGLRDDTKLYSTRPRPTFSEALQ